ncbi:WG repeat-containing protein [Achromobacter seleniivolatilans]|uniref:WG repeat-containing protein n=1 Tax=Achromobacter seleniivolatilans TaxID=3047478 RepID=A0ABY9LYR1_9BURK|nr:WG repeat-containing protein [Achromobacter sp. R39]WMD19911.1 WG repeat-containing protein [Achromobacter sp. R39]
MTSRVFHITRIALALAALGASLSAQAQSGHLYCLDEGNYLSYPEADDIAGRNPFANGCIRDLADDRAAVLLPSALEHINRVPVDASLRRHAWGFLDQNGRLAIRPIFESVRNFHHGLAAVQWKGKWGYIDKKGRMAVAPRFDEAQDYVEAGLAVVVQDGQPLLIDRLGKPVGEPLDASIQSLTLNDGLPARATVQYKAEYRSATGERRFAVAGVTLFQPYTQGLIIATNADGKYGVLDRDWKWLIEPTYEDIQVERKGGLAVAQGRDGAVLISHQGAVIGADQQYDNINPIGRVFWSARLARDGFAVLDAAGALVVKMSGQEARSSELFNDTIVYATDKTRMALVPGQAAPITLGRSLRPSQNDEGFIMFSDGETPNAGLLTPTGVWLHGDTAPAWLANSGQMEVRQGKLWIMKPEGGLLNVVDTDGRALLKPETVEAAQTMQLNPLPLNVPGGPLAVLAQGHCQCGPSGAALLLADGSLVSDASWTELTPLEEGADQGQYNDAESNASRPDPLKPDQLRFAAETPDGMQLLDARGKPMDLPLQQHIGKFHYGYAQIYAKGVSRMIDRNGKTYDLPDVFEAQVVAPGVVRFLKAAAEDEPWGLYDFVAGKQLAAPAFRGISDFHDGQAVATLGPDREGVIDLQGNWIVPPKHYAVQGINDKLWKVLQAGKQEDDYSRPAAVFNDKGRALTAFLPRLQVAEDSDGSIKAGTDTNRWIISPDGNDALDMQDARYVRMGDWMQIDRPPRQGYLNSQGKWQIEASVANGSLFQGVPARALSTDGTVTRVIDAQGKAVATLPAGSWSWGLGSNTLQKHYSVRGKTMTDYTDLTGKTRLTVAGFASAYSEGRAVVELSSNSMRAADDKGALIGPAFDALGTMSNGLAPASVGRDYGYVDRNGKFAIAAEFKAVTPFLNQRAVASSTEDSRIITPDGTRLAYVELVCGIRTLYGASGQRLWPVNMPKRCMR